MTNLLDNFSNEEETPTTWENLEFEEIEEEVTESNQWKPEPNEEIIGKYISTNEGKGRGEGLTFHTLEDQQGTEISILGCTVLNNKLEKVMYGSIIKIIYKGYVTSEKGRSYKDYDVLIYRGNN